MTKKLEKITSAMGVEENFEHNHQLLMEEVVVQINRLEIVLAGLKKVILS